jgi:hypothetical protein
MQIKPKFGIDKLLFGMKINDVKSLFGEPNKQFKDEDKNLIYVYNQHQLRLTFYEDEAFRLGYMICSNPDLLLYDAFVIGRKVEEIKKDLEKHHYKTWEK